MESHSAEVWVHTRSVIPVSTDDTSSTAARYQDDGFTHPIVSSIRTC